MARVEYKDGMVVVTGADGEVQMVLDNARLKGEQLPLRVRRASGGNGNVGRRMRWKDGSYLMTDQVADEVYVKEMGIS
ncbi:hypothetical protein KKC08_02350 [Patescibacteria group bacterium]|nr:hypothetical protein [Patescibacteria group bacterium]MCG2702104.1 hypothetical protein [Candidatus Parcubacteria bacterium]MBU4265582.1 hypothetical protein [Patescibacteria group bacterium]MBU4390812.1 hypothetical protein [Patescibacteria group bacterium]MBU4396981.1 hypothetical protein [Patescibacteria group bacterium]